MSKRTPRPEDEMPPPRPNPKPYPIPPDDVEPDTRKAYRKGGYVRAADGIAKRGKTRGEMVAMCGGGRAKK